MASIPTGRMKLSKFIDGSLAKTVVMKDTELTVMTFDQNIYQDTGLYAQVLNSECSYTTSSATIRRVQNVEGDTIFFIRKDLETEKGIHYELKPRYEQNLANNRKSRFVHYSAANSVEGDRQTFEYAFLSAIKAVREVFSSKYSKYFQQTYDLYEDGGENRVRTLAKIYLPDEELTRDIIRNKKSNKFRFTLLCIISLYFLQKTFTLNRLEISQYDKNCEDIMRYFEDMQSIFTDEEKSAYLDFLYVISTGRCIELLSDGSICFTYSRQTRFFYDIDCDRPITFQGVAIDGSQIQLNSTIEKLAEDISIILGYHRLTLASYSERGKNEVYNIIEYFVYPNIVDSPIYRECVTKLVNDLYSCDDIVKLETYKKIASGIEIEDTEPLPIALAKDIIKRLYGFYPEKYINYVKFCRSELSVSKLVIAPEAATVKDPYSYTVPLGEAVEDSVMIQTLEQQSKEPEPDGVLKMGYSFIGRDLLDVLDIGGIDRNWLLDTRNGVTPTELNIGYSLNYNPAWHSLMSKVILSNANIRKNRDRSKSISRYEFINEVIKNLVLAIENLPKSAKVGFDNEKMCSVLGSYLKICESKAKKSVTYRQHMYKARKILQHLKQYGSLIQLTRVITFDTVSYDIEVDILTIKNITSLLLSAIKQVHSVSKESEFIGDNLTNIKTQSAFKVFEEASRQLMYFYADFLKNYEIYEDVHSFIGSFIEENGEEDIQFCYEETDIIDTEYIKDELQDLVYGHEEFVEGFKELDSYLARNNNLFCLRDCKILAYPERKMFVYSLNSAGSNQELGEEYFWEPSYIKLNFNIPYPEYMRLISNNQQKYTIIPERQVSRIKKFK